MADQTITIPKEWKASTLEEVVLKASTGADAIKRAPIVNLDTGIKCLRIQDVSQKKDYKSWGFTSVSASDFEKFQLKKGELFIARTGASIGVNLIINKDLNAVFNNGLIRLRVNNKSIPEYVSYLLFSKSFKNYILSISQGTSTQPNIQIGALLRFPIMIPPISEQHAIVSVLSSLDKKIDLLKEQNKTLEATAQTIFKEWFVNFNFPGATGKMIDSELGEIPEGWRVGTVNDVIERFSITYRCDQDDLSLKGKTPIFDQGTNGLYGYTERGADFQASTENPVILFTNHTCNMWFVNYPFCAIQNVIPFRGNADYNTFFVFYMTLGKVKFIEYKGHWPDFEQKKHIIPKPEIANQFAEFVKPLQYKIWNNNSQAETLSKLRDTLLPKLMKGEVRVAGFND